MPRVSIVKKTVKVSKSRGTVLVLVGLLAASAILRLASGAGAVFAQVSPAAPDNQPERQQTENSGNPTPERLQAMLQAFEAREKNIRDREIVLEQRMKVLNEAEARVSQQLEDLEQAEQNLRATIALASTAAEDDLARLTAVYENMKPKTAAALFEEMAPEFAAGFLGRMRPDAAASIMAGMKPETAYTVSTILAGRNANVPKN